MKYLLPTLSIFSALSLTTWAQNIFHSPSKSLQAELSVSADGRLTYTVSKSGKVVIEPSKMGVTIDGVDYGAGVKLGASSLSQVSESYPLRGHKAEAKNHYQGVTIPVTHSDGVTYQLDLRVYDEGFAYRYRVPGKGTRTLNGETSSFQIPEKTKIWFFERKNAWKLKSYAGEWHSAMIEEMPKISKVGPVQGFPLVIEYPSGGYGVLCEAAVFNYSGMRAEAIGNRTFQANFTEGKKGFQLEGDITTPWRAVIAVDTLNELANQTLVMNLAPAPDPEIFADQSWIKPGWCAWRWQLQGVGLPNHQEVFIKHAETLGYPYSLIDDGWEYDWSEPWVKLKELCTYADQRRVKLFVWKRWADVQDPANNYEQLRTWLDKLVDAGVVGAKVDFFDAEDLVKRRGEEAVLREAAKRKLMINFHGCPKPTGEARTYPNEVTREGIRGLELNFIRSEGLLSARHNTALPFTRLTLGHGDYTPLTFQPGHMGDVTLAHHCATAVLITSPMQVLNAIPTNLIHYPMKELPDFFRTLPAVWDETIVLEGSEIGELAVMARRKGKDWYVGALNGGDAKPYTLKLDFLGKEAYESLVISDLVESPIAVKAQKSTVNGDQEISLNLSKGGGFVARFQTR